MQPTIVDGSNVLVFRWAYILPKPKIGDIIVVRHDGKEFVKRIASIKNNQFLVEGDNKKDSRDMPEITKSP